MARGFHTSGTGGPSEGEVIDFSSCMIKINEDCSVDIVSPLMTMAAAPGKPFRKIVSEVLQIPLDKVEMSPSGTRDTGYDVATHATRGVFCGGGAANFVALKVREKLLEVAGRVLLENAIDLEVMMMKPAARAWWW